MKFLPFKLPARLASFWERPHDPPRDWFSLLGIAAILLALIVVWNISVFDTVAGNGTIGRRAPSASSLVNQSTLDSIHGIFERRAQEEERYQTGAYRYADPSR